MKKFAIAAVAGVAAIAAVPFGVSPAKAQVLPQVSLTGNDTVSLTDHTIQFTGNGQISNNSSIGSPFTTLFPHNGGTTPVTMIGNGPTCPPTGSTPCATNILDFTNPSQWINGRLFGSSQLDVTITSFNESLTTIGANNSLNLFGNAVLGFGLPVGGTSPGTWDLTTQWEGTGGPFTTTFSATAAVPGPIVGAGLPGLIASLGGLVAIARRRRNQLA